MAFAAVTAPALLALSQTKLFQQKDQIQQVLFAASIPVQATYLSNLSSTLYLKGMDNSKMMQKWWDIMST